MSMPLRALGRIKLKPFAKPKAISKVKAALLLVKRLGSNKRNDNQH